jgi:flagellar basal body rod protein FlgG
VTEVTGDPMDIAISGKGFFTVNGPRGPLYTRNGRLRVLPGGELGNSDGQALATAGGGTIRVLPNKSIIISPDGRVQQDGQTMGQIGVVNFKNTDSLRKLTASSFENTDPTKNPAAPAANATVEQGKLEGSNVPVADAAMRLVGVMRQFEMLQKAIGVSSDMDNKSIQEVARVTA